MAKQNMSEQTNAPKKRRLSDIENPTLNDVKPPDRVHGYPRHVPRWYTKLFELIPALITYGTLASPFFFVAIGKPEFFVYYMSFLTVFWAIRGIVFAYGITNAYRIYRKEMAIDWMQRIKDEELDDSDLRYMMVYPLYREDIDIIRPAIQGWANSTIDTKKFTIVFAIEEKFSEQEIEYIKEVEKELGDKFERFIIKVHPQIEGEVRGVKTGNINWATRLYYEQLEDEGKDPSDYLLITCDSDQIPDPQYLAAITYKYLTDEKPMRTAYTTAVHTFRNNIWRVPILVRVMFNFVTVAIMHKWGLHKSDANATFSAYVVNLQTVHEVEYWDPELENDDTAFYWNARTRFNGDFKTEAVYVPTHNDAVENETQVKTYKSLWMQQVRWGWGQVVFPMAWSTLYKNPDITLKERARMFRHTFDDRLLFRTAVYLLTFGLPILALLSPEYRYSSSSYNLPKVMSFLLTGAMFLNIPIFFVRRSIIKIPQGWNLFRHAIDVFEVILLTIILLTYGFMPTTQAQTGMMFRKGPKKDHYVTDKVAIKK